MSNDYDSLYQPDRRAAGPITEALGQSEAFLAFQEALSRAARVDRPVLVVGERGTGKELAVHRMHFLSTRWEEPFVALNCSALAPTLIESELFGHEAGAFTGAAKQRRGRFEAAHGGTLFLDEIANIPLEVQEKILRVVEYGSFERVGGSQPVAVDVRIIGATNADLRVKAREGMFMRDLLDRLAFEVLFVPPLRARREDIMHLANHFAARMAHEMGWDGIPEFAEDAIEALEAHHWPGNIRELKNVVERAVYRGDDSIIRREEIIFDPFQPPYAAPVSALAAAGETTAPEEPQRKASPPSDEALELPPKSFEEIIRDTEQELLNRALKKARYNQRQAAKLLGLTYHQFRRLYRKYKEAPGSQREIAAKPDQAEESAGYR